MSDWQRVIDSCESAGLKAPENMFEVSERIDELSDQIDKLKQENEKLSNNENIRKFLDRFQKAAEKQQFALNNGGWGHAGWCNYQRPEGNGKGICNCGVVDLQTVLKDYLIYINNHK